MLDLKDKVIVVTGSSKGFGLAIGRLLLQKQAKVVFCSRSMETSKSSLGIDSAKSFPINLDICDIKSIRHARSKILDRFGSIDIVVNNAGDNGRVCRLIDCEPGEERNIFETHVFGTLNMIREFVPTMRNSGSGIIVNFASIIGYVPMPGSSAYSAAKAAIVSLTTSLRHELKSEGIDLRLFVPTHATNGHNIDRATQNTPESVAKTFVDALQAGRSSFISEGFLVNLKRLLPRTTQSIMNSTGEGALKVNLPGTRQG